MLILPRPCDNDDNEKNEKCEKCECETLYIDNVTQPKEVYMCDYCSERKNNTERKYKSVYSRFKKWVGSFF